MTEEQLQVFWDNFRVISDIQYDKPPAGWKPPPFRDMTEAEKEAYWAAFRTIMKHTCDKIPDSHGVDVPELLPQEEPIVRRRIKGKKHDPSFPVRFPKMLADDALVLASAMKGEPSDASLPISGGLVSLKFVEASRARNAKTQLKRKGSDEPPQSKRQYVPKVKVDRKGKRPCVSIFRRVHLFKEPQ